MRRRLDQLLRFYRSPLGKKLYRYVMGSVITTVVSFGVLTLVYGVLHWWGAIGSTVFANVVATVPAYYLNRQWTWGKYGRSDMWREIVPFWVLSVAGIAISMGTAALAAHVAQTHDLHGVVEDPIVAGANRAAHGPPFAGTYLIFELLFKGAAALRSAEPAESPSKVPVGAQVLSVTTAGADYTVDATSLEPPTHDAAVSADTIGHSSVLTTAPYPG